MITWILSLILLIWILANRFSQDGKVEGLPLGMPRGTVRAFITLMIATFPFGYLLNQDPIPPLIINAIFIVVAFYFEARRSEHEKLQRIVNEIKNPELVTLNLTDEKKPLYLPKFTVRVSLVATLVFIQIAIFLTPNISFQITNTLVDVLLIVSLFMIGAFFRSIVTAREKKKLKAQVADMDASLSDAEIVEKLMLQEQSWWKSKGKSLLSIVMLSITTAALLFYTFNFDYQIVSLPQYGINLSFQGILLLLVNVYYGFRD